MLFSEAAAVNVNILTNILSYFTYNYFIKQGNACKINDSRPMCSYTDIHLWIQAQGYWNNI